MRTFIKYLFISIITVSFIACGGGDGGGNPGTLQFSAASFSGNEDSGAISVRVTRTGGSSGAVSIEVFDAGSGSATSGADYEAVAQTRLSWGSGDSTAKTISVTPFLDATFEPDETVVLGLRNVTGGASVGRASTTVSILNDDANTPGQLQFDATSYTVQENVGTLTVTVTRTGGTSGAASVVYSTGNGTAEQPSDYITASGTLDWVDGEALAKSFDITIVNDNTAETTESFNLALSNVTGATLGTPSTATVTINDNDFIIINGSVRAPGGSLAFRQPGLLQRMFAMLFGEKVSAAINDLVSPVNGANVNLYEVNASGNVVGGVINTATTDASGDFILGAPSDVFDGANYIVRASGATEIMDSRVTSTTLSVDPSTDATSQLVSTVVTDLAYITPQEVIELQDDIENLIPVIDKSALNASVLSERLFEKALSRVGMYNVLRSKVSQGQICGHVQSSTNSPLEGIRILVRDYVDRKTRARTYTDAGGDYCVNVPVLGDSNPDGGTFNGQYIIGAINRTTETSNSASEWFGNGNTYTEDEAAQLLVLNTTPVNGTDFTLEQGARITGTVQAEGTLAGLEGIQVVVRDYDSRRRMASTNTEADGSYSVSVIPGTYLVIIRNRTTAAYSSEVYAPSFITNPSWTWGEPVSASAGQTVAIDHVLESGFQLSGNVNDGAPVVDTEVVIDWTGGLKVESVDTDRNGDYNIWLKAGETFDVYAHGQRNKDLIFNADTVVDFTALASSLSTISGQLTDGSNPVNNTTIRLHRRTDPTTTLLRGYASVDKNGNFTLLTDEVGEHILEMRVTKEVGVGSMIYDNQTQLLGGDIINISSTGSSHPLGTVTMPEGGILRGHVYIEGSSSGTLTPFTNMRVQVRDGGNQLDNRFIQVRVRADGSYVVALPAGTYERVKMRDANATGNCDSVAITAGVITVLNFYDGDDVCEVIP